MSKSKFLRTSLLSASALICASLVSPALAQDNNKDFSGVYGGAEVGYSSIDADLILSDGIVDASVDLGKITGLSYGGFIGARVQARNNIVYGIEGYFGGSTNSVSATANGVTAKVNTGRTFGVDGILGYAVSNKVMVFAHGGYINKSLKFSIHDDFISISTSDSEGGWRYGGGVEMKIKKNVSARVKATFGKISSEVFNDGVHNVDIDFKLFSVTAGVLVSF